MLAMADPLDIEAIDDVEMRTGLRVTPGGGEPFADRVRDRQVRRVVDAFHDVVQTSLDEEAGADEAAAAGEDVPIVRLVNQLIREAVRDGASDIHVEPRRRSVVVRNRIDGVCKRS